MPIIIEKHIEEAQSRNKWLWASFVEKHNHSGALQSRYDRVDSAGGFGISKSVFWDTFYEIMMFAKGEKRGAIVMKIAEHNILTLDYWRDEVSYQGITLPSGTIGCAALNIPDDVIDRLKQIYLPLLTTVEAVNNLRLKPELLAPCRDSILQMLELLQKENTFPLLNYSYYLKRIPEIFTDENMKKAEAYVKLAAMNLPAAMSDQLKSGLGLTKVIAICAQLPDSLVMFKQGLLPFAQALHESDRAVEDYAAVFGEYFPEFPEFSLSEPSWMSLINVSMQYLSTILPGKDAPQLVKRMHFVSFVGMLRYDLFEGLCVGHAPRKCPICGRWFLTTDARHTKYCGGLAPGAPKGRTCRQLGNLQGREKRELADDHPLKVIYNRRMNTIQVYVRRGTLDEATAEKMKRLARNKLERAISDAAYASGSYADEMEQDALLREATS